MSIFDFQVNYRLFTDKPEDTASDPVTDNTDVDDCDEQLGRGFKAFVPSGQSSQKTEEGICNYRGNF